MTFLLELFTANKIEYHELEKYTLNNYIDYNSPSAIASNVSRDGMKKSIPVIGLE